MTARVLTGSKQEIAEKVAGINGEIREVIVFVDEMIAPNSVLADTFAEMEAFTVRRADVDDSRQAIYSRLEGE
jgi:hypothetical protein